MAGLVKKPSGIWNVNWYHESEYFNLSTGTKDEKAAEVIRGRVQDVEFRIKHGFVTAPPVQDRKRVAEFFMSGGIVKEAVKAVVTLSELFTAYESAVHPENMDWTTYGIHKGHLLRILGNSRSVASLTRDVLRDDYVAIRKKEKKGKIQDTKVSPATIKKELKRLKSVWGECAELVGSIPLWQVKDFKSSLPKPPDEVRFLTFEQIQAEVSQGGLSDKQVRMLWSGLFLTSEDLRELLDYVETNHPKAYPPIAFAALTGARQSSLIESQRGDINFQGRHVEIRTRKIDGTVRIFRVDLHPRLAEVMQGHLQTHKKRLTFCNPDGNPLEPHQCQTLFRLATKDHPKFSKLTGWHKLRHSFISVLCSKGVDQRIISGYVGHFTAEQEARYRHLIPKTENRPIDLLL